MVLALIGLQVEAVAEIASWMPHNYFNRGGPGDLFGLPVPVGYGGRQAKCLISGGIGMGVFTVFGWWKLRRQEF